MTASDEVTWIGHSTMLLEVNGIRVITDPLLTRRVAHLRRRRPLPDPTAAEVDLVLISHAHMDHLHIPSLRRLSPAARFIAPVGLAPLLRAAGLHDITEVVGGDSIAHESLTIEVVYAEHKCGRGPHSRVKAAPIGYVIDTGLRRFYFAGDTGLFPDMANLRDIDVALLPIWGWGPSVGWGHLDPAGAAEASQLIQPGLVVPMHWGTYSPEDGRRGIPSRFDEPLVRFEAELRAVGAHDRLHMLEPGGSLRV